MIETYKPLERTAAEARPYLVVSPVVQSERTDGFTLQFVGVWRSNRELAFRDSSIWLPPP